MINQIIETINELKKKGKPYRKELETLEKQIEIIPLEKTPQIAYFLATDYLHFKEIENSIKYIEFGKQRVRECFKKNIFDRNDLLLLCGDLSRLYCTEFEIASLDIFKEYQMKFKVNHIGVKNLDFSVGIHKKPYSNEKAKKNRKERQKNNSSNFIKANKENKSNNIISSNEKSEKNFKKTEKSKNSLESDVSFHLSTSLEFENIANSRNTNTRFVSQQDIFTILSKNLKTKLEDLIKSDDYNIVLKNPRELFIWCYKYISKHKKHDLMHFLLYFSISDEDLKNTFFLYNFLSYENIYFNKKIANLDSEKHKNLKYYLIFIDSTQTKISEICDLIISKKNGLEDLNILFLNALVSKKFYILRNTLNYLDNILDAYNTDLSYYKILLNKLTNESDDIKSLLYTKDNKSNNKINKNIGKLNRKKLSMCNSQDLANDCVVSETGKKLIDNYIEFLLLKNEYEEILKYSYDEDLLFYCHLKLFETSKALDIFERKISPILSEQLNKASFSDCNPPLSESNKNCLFNPEISDKITTKSSHKIYPSKYITQKHIFKLFLLLDDFTNALNIISNIESPEIFIKCLKLCYKLTKTHNTQRMHFYRYKKIWN
ncbi:hypothetical protein EDEG_00431 [Edhazardia aedis USNM 41457]|uniref:Uncharacterized protein n=1 Tax=Edhazardia aedis (strain USNM 41457) TaxID=1003232 RepID=J9DJG6_EDHAE|nr:hypothetical protein EDEG_00431 [Edhazardia aedis USNM 41457]|eukprot:EJW01517.1 hypothetical protein EDEG_00431 [Edhazardia aedis USNM 41457]